MALQHKMGDLSPEEFVLRSIERLRKPPYKGIHSVYSGFNEAFRKYFPLLDPVTVVTQLATEGKVATRPVRGGVLIYKASEAPWSTSAQSALDKILADKPVETENNAPDSDRLL